MDAGRSGSLQVGRASIQYEPGGQHPAWDALREWPSDSPMLSTKTRTYPDGFIRRSPPLPVLVVRLRFWFLGALAMVLPAGRLALAAGRRWQRRRHAARGRCPACGYDLTGNASGTCPECGTAVADAA